MPKGKFRRIGLSCIVLGVLEVLAPCKPQGKDESKGGNLGDFLPQRTMYILQAIFEKMPRTTVTLLSQTLARYCCNPSDHLQESPGSLGLKFEYFRGLLVDPPKDSF